MCAKAVSKQLTVTSMQEICQDFCSLLMQAVRECLGVPEITQADKTCPVWSWNADSTTCCLRTLSRFKH